jgi:hypothetical protein
VPLSARSPLLRVHALPEETIFLRPRSRPETAGCYEGTIEQRNGGEHAGIYPQCNLPRVPEQRRSGHNSLGRQAVTLTAIAIYAIGGLMWVAVAIGFSAGVDSPGVTLGLNF